MIAYYISIQVLILAVKCGNFSIILTYFYAYRILTGQIIALNSSHYPKKNRIFFVVSIVSSTGVVYSQFLPDFIILEILAYPS